MGIQNRKAVWMEGGSVCMVDQRLLPHREVILRLDSYRETTDAIRDMAVRGAGTIGAAAGFAMAQAVLQASPSHFWQDVEEAAFFINAARPTAKNLSYAVDRVHAASKESSDPKAARAQAVREAQAVYDDDVRMTRAIAEAALPLLPQGKAVMTHCNAGWLAYPGWGTALAAFYLAHEQGRSVFVYATETRPRSQGAKLTAWELSQEGIPHVLIADTAAGYTIATGEVGLIIVGADRIAANGDTANKIGTYTLSVLAKEHKIPFYVAAPSPTFDARCPDGIGIPNEERDEREVLEASGSALGGEKIFSVRVATPGSHAKNPAFDVTPASHITGFVTECGVVSPTQQSISSFLKLAQASRRG